MIKAIRIGDVVEYHGSIADAHGLYVVEVVPADVDGDGFRIRGIEPGRDMWDQTLSGVRRKSFTFVQDRMDVYLSAAVDIRIERTEALLAARKANATILVGKWSSRCNMCQANVIVYEQSACVKCGATFTIMRSEYINMDITHMNVQRVESGLPSLVVEWTYDPNMPGA